MPELPEVESVRKQLHDALVGRVIARAQLLRPDYLTVFAPAPARHAAQLLQHHTVANTARRGKQLALLTEQGPCLVVQLGMSGQVTISPPPPDPPTPNLQSADPRCADSPPPHTHALFTLDNHTRILFRDARRFGHLTWYPDPESLHTHRWNLLGPDALTITADQLTQALAKTTRPVKAALLDQCLLAGVGNIYADEALHLAAIHPNRPAHRLRPPELGRLSHAIRTILQSAVHAGGSTVSTYRTPAGATGGYQLAHRVYARASLPCLACQTPLRSAQIAQRTTVWCPNCQPRRRAPIPPIAAPHPTPTIHTRFTPATPPPALSRQTRFPASTCVKTSS